MIDRELVTRKLVLIAEDLPAIERLAARAREEYLASPTDELVAARLLEIATDVTEYLDRVRGFLDRSAD